MSDKKQCQPQKIEVNSRWKDGWGAKVTVIKSDGFQILFLRDGYAHPCRMTDYRFTREFKYLPDESAESVGAAKEKGLEKSVGNLPGADGKTTLPLSVGSDGFDKEFK